ncbi:MAG TPA: hypothetical protein VLR26_14270 [Frankiaceae bacterium]|nr:hypothetical protein [Frankiaceae bacterium]
MTALPIRSRTTATALGLGLLLLSLGTALPAHAALPAQASPAAQTALTASSSEAPNVSVSAPAAPTGAGRTVRPSSVHTIALTDAVSMQTTGRGAGSASVRDSGPRETAGFSLVGISWDRSSAPTASFSVRTHAGGRWTGWSTLATSDLAPDAGRPDDRTSRRTTEPLWVGSSDGVQVRLLSASRRLSGVRIELVDPGRITGRR